jgi:hypothetical protein
MQSSDKQRAIVDYFKERLLARPKGLVRAGLSIYFLKQLIDDGLVIELGRGFCQLAEQDVSEWHSYLEVQRQAPNRIYVFCRHWPLSRSRALAW